MQFKYFTLGLICLLYFVGLLQSRDNRDVYATNNQPPRNLLTNEDAFSIVSYFRLFFKSHERYLESNEESPWIECKKCMIKDLELGEFDGGLIGWVLIKLGSTKPNVEQIKKICAERVSVIEKGDIQEIMEYMARIANETGQVCTECHSRNGNWGAPE